ncbi:hypothetical protein CEXT_73701 [Caerostris extrusa]|uniref:Uncharacterized protein n=1 Tax=Caerostris extrusa TaxID=172846 RepID=A0AAV4M961_CAEEX|nr:hypothetical protein CEXT_73701 [Caerostris extrusa]
MGEYFGGQQGGRISRKYEQWTGPLDLPMVTSLCMGGGQEVPDVIRAAAGTPGRPAEGWAPGISSSSATWRMVEWLRD